MRCCASSNAASRCAAHNGHAQRAAVALAWVAGHLADFRRRGGGFAWCLGAYPARHGADSYAPRWVAWPVRAYSDIVRGLPHRNPHFLCHHYAMLALKVNVSGWWAAASARSRPSETAHVSEVTRGAAMQSIPTRPEAGRDRPAYFRCSACSRGHLPPGSAPFPAAMDQHGCRYGEGQRAGLAGRHRRPDARRAPGHWPQRSSRCPSMCWGRRSILSSTTRSPS